MRYAPRRIVSARQVASTCMPAREGGAAVYVARHAAGLCHEEPRRGRRASTKYAAQLRVSSARGSSAAVRAACYAGVPVPCATEFVLYLH